MRNASTLRAWNPGAFSEDCELSVIPDSSSDEERVLKLFKYGLLLDGVPGLDRGEFEAAALILSMGLSEVCDCIPLAVWKREAASERLEKFFGSLSLGGTVLSSNRWVCDQNWNNKYDA